MRSNFHLKNNKIIKNLFAKEHESMRVRRTICAFFAYGRYVLVLRMGVKQVCWLNSSYWPIFNLHAILLGIPPIGYRYFGVRWLKGYHSEIENIISGKLKEKIVNPRPVINILFYSL